MAVDSGHYAKTEAILDYFLPDTRSPPAEVTCDDFMFVTKVAFGGSEGIYFDCYAEGRIQTDGETRMWHPGTYKTLDTSLSAMQILGEWGGTLTYFASKYLWGHSDRFLSDRELRARAIQGKHTKHDGCDDPEGSLRVTHALSLNDTFWVRKADAALCWEDVSLYTNPFSEIISEAAFDGIISETDLSSTSPEFETDGYYAKCWKREDGGIYLYKSGSAVV